MRRILIGTLGLALVAGCATQVPDSGPEAGAGFYKYDSYAANREAQLQSGAVNAAVLPPAQVVSGETLASTPVQVAGQPLDAIGMPGGAAGSDDPAQLAMETQAALAATSANSGVVPVQASPGNPAPEAVNTFGISRENDFGAVGQQRSIESDAERLAQVRAQYEQVQPKALPPRTGEGPNIVTYALQTSHQPGQQMYSRSPLTTQAGYQRRCGGYPSPDLAQTDFLRNGGPDRDRKGLDPDGDGFACSWDPRPFRSARGG